MSDTMEMPEMPEGFTNMDPKDIPDGVKMQIAGQMLREVVVSHAEDGRGELAVALAEALNEFWLRWSMTLNGLRKKDAECN